MQDLERKLQLARNALIRSGILAGSITTKLKARYGLFNRAELADVIAAINAIRHITSKTLQDLR